MNDLEAAEADLALLEKMPEKRSNIMFAIGMLKYKQGKYQEAQLAFDELLGVNSEYIPAYFYAGAAASGAWKPGISGAEPAQIFGKKGG